METVKLMNTEKIMKFIEEMPFNKAYAAIASDYEQNGDRLNGEGWWSILKLKYADAETLIFDYLGGGTPIAYCIDGMDGENTVKAAVEDFLDSSFFYGKDNKYAVDTQLCELS